MSDAHAMPTAAQRLDALLVQLQVRTPFRPPGARALTAAQALALLPEPLAHFYGQLDLLRFGALELFQIDDYIEVNRERAGFDELAQGVFVASDLAEGWFFVDPVDFMGLGEGFVFWCDRGLLAADECVPAADSLIDLLEAAALGGKPWQAPPLGERALARLVERLQHSPAVATRPPVDPARFHLPGAPALPLRLGDILMQADGFLLPVSQREFFGLAAIAPVPGSGDSPHAPGALWVGQAPQGQRLASSTGSGWRGLPADRLLAVAPGQAPEEAPVLGRTADVWTRWIQDDEAL